MLSLSYRKAFGPVAEHIPFHPKIQTLAFSHMVHKPVDFDVSQFLIPPKLEFGLH